MFSCSWVIKTSNFHAPTNQEIWDPSLEILFCFHLTKPVCQAISSHRHPRRSIAHYAFLSFAEDKRRPLLLWVRRSLDRKTLEVQYLWYICYLECLWISISFSKLQHQPSLDVLLCGYTARSPSHSHLFPRLGPQGRVRKVPVFWSPRMGRLGRRYTSIIMYNSTIRMY